MGWGMATVEYGKVRGPFYRAGGWEGRQCGDGNGRRWSAPLMAFNLRFWEGKGGGDARFRRVRGGGRAALDSVQRRRPEGMGARRRANVRLRGGGVVRRKTRRRHREQGVFTQGRRTWCQA
jgi:hypothetical protein